MRKQSRSATLVVAAMVGAGSLLAQLGGGAASANEDRTDSETYTESRADYWAARAAYAAKKAAREAAKAAGVEYVAPDEEGGGAGKQAQAVAAAAPVALVDGYPTNAQLAALRMCESTDNYSANTGNGYYGAYQFSPITWWWLGYTGYPHQASPAVQDEAARYLYSIFGWTPWPACSWYLGFR
ncbi:MAG: transglycosylase family protein [Acidimicrobiales bacterium]